jgi:hypothetical protein
MENEKNYFEILSQINVNDKTEKKNGLTYLSWAWAIGEITKKYPDLTYEIEKFENNLPYIFDEKTGYMVFTKVTIQGITKEMWLPVMDSNNKAMLDQPYEYSTKYGTKTVEKATMFDINKTIMRCLAKNLAMFGLGLYIYAGEDLPENIVSEETTDKLCCENCGKEFVEVVSNGKKYTSKDLYNGAKSKYDGLALCKECGKQYLENKGGK